MEKTLKDIYDKLNSYFIINRDSIVNLNYILCVEIHIYLYKYKSNNNNIFSKIFLKTKPQFLYCDFII